MNTVSEQAVTATIRRAGDRTRQVQIRRCTVETVTSSTGDAPERSPGPGRASVAVSLRVSVGRDRSVVEVSDQLRAAVIESVLKEVGMRVVTVDITVEDLHDD